MTTVKLILIEKSHARRYKKFNAFRVTEGDALPCHSWFLHNAMKMKDSEQIFNRQKNTLKEEVCSLVHLTFFSAMKKYTWNYDILLRFEIKRVKLCFPRLPSDCLKFHHGRRHFKTNSYSSFSWQSVQQKSIFTDTRLSTVRGDFLCAESISKWWRWWSNFERVWWQLTCVRLAAFFSIWSHGFFVVVFVFVVEMKLISFHEDSSPF